MNKLEKKQVKNNEQAQQQNNIEELLAKRENELNAQKSKIVRKEKDIDQERALLLEEKKQLSIELSKAKELQNVLEKEKIALSHERINVEKGLPHQVANYKQQLDEQVKHKEKQLDSLKNDLEQSRDKLMKEQQDLTVKAERLSQQEQGFELACQQEKQTLLDAFNAEITAKRDTVNAEIIASKNAAHNALDNELKEKREQLEFQQQELAKQTETVTKQKAENQLKSADINAKREALDQHINEGVIDKKVSLEKSLKQKEDEIERLRNSLESAETSLGLYKDLEKQLGSEPARVLAELSATKEEINRLNEELLERPTKEIEDYYDKAKAELSDAQDRADRFANENQQLQNQVKDIEQLSYQLQRAESELDTSKSLFSSKEAENNKLKAEIDRLKVSYEDESNREERLQQIQSGVISRLKGENELPVWPADTKEISWLNTIKKKVSNYGLEFDYRILYSFHTALKISEWSPLTVLAGVSGTGKSELPKLYSHFGGINFMSVPVQPNWDSQESMLGYFNAIDNVFDAQPILKFLIQSQTEKSVNPNGLKDMMNLVLLDEMNLAHVEMYFADFLSKLEDRRAADKDNLPTIDIKLGAKHEPHKLALGRNMLFAGTMNQDETTKALSDKVLDRGVTIYFPRPTTLIARKKLEKKEAPSHFLSTKQWHRWVKLESSLPGAEHKKYKGIIESINNHLGEVGKALGHRVWQSIEYFMVNHPLVLAFSANGFDDANYKKALHFAFEDQLVQKVMPKLRGIETRGIGKERCLSPIRALLDDKKFNIVADFERAMVMGHGQFMWCSADYLNDDESKKEYLELVKAIPDDFNKQPQTHTPKIVAKKITLSQNQLNLLNTYSRNSKITIDGLLPAQIAECLQISGFDAKDIKEYLVENAPKVQA
ncbi:hypothetical protein H5187_18345 [Pseudoalteromonas sp. SG44-1]|nr:MULTISPECIES: hypothetical protein [unclassified Pseudoalteromonas]MBB1419214.1 hypothetical protein [Pseudoalteromonas sp. SG44-1]MBB1478041.1 hypothetical protein [Pseudoalteromonas sp. SG41-2]